MAPGGLTRIRVGSGTARVARVRRAGAFACGLLLATGLLLGAGEAYLRVTPPSDTAEHLGVLSPKTGPFEPHPIYGAQYRSLEALDADNPGKLSQYRPLLNCPRPPKVWAFFGSSFAQAPGMLADTTRRFVPTRFTFNLGKNEIVPVRLAQAEFLLDAGLPVEHLFVVVIPLDGYFYAMHGLDQIRVTPGGGISYDPRFPETGGWLVRTSRLVRQGWTQTGLHANRPFYRVRQLNTRYDGAVLADFVRVYEEFAKTAARHRVPVTVVLLPNHEQVTQGAGFAFQDAVAPRLRELGYDVCDVRGAFLAFPNKPALFIPDKHFSDVGNRLLLATLLSHLKATDPASADLPDPNAVRP
ncbi:hypothetical protein [Gemmata sp.]|uniref:hypothetical protein n=1 Tax=Gemmata sp. TaxID=1914242 RepID=UPI003F6E8E7D